MFSFIMLSTDGSDHANKALEVAVDLALKYQARLQIVHVLLQDATAAELRRSVDLDSLDAATKSSLSKLGAVSVPRPVGTGLSAETPPRDMLEKIGRHILKQAVAYARNKGVVEVSSLLEDGNAAKRIAAVAKLQDVDMLVMGSRGLGAWESVLLHGSVTQQVRHVCDCCCLTVV